MYVLYYSVMYYNYAGGVVAINRENFNRINGYSNSYWGWGNEDDDFSARYGLFCFLMSLPGFLNQGSMRSC